MQSNTKAHKLTVVKFPSKEFNNYLERIYSFCDFHRMYPTLDKFTSQETIDKLYTCFYRRMESTEAYDCLMGLKQMLRRRRPKERMHYQKWLNEIERFIYAHYLMRPEDVTHQLDMVYLQTAYEKGYTTLEGVDVVLGFVNVLDQDD